MYWSTYVATTFDDWRNKFLVYVKADDTESAWQALTAAGYCDWYYTEQPVSYSHLPNDEVRA
jgi:hypothetical protein